MEKNDIIKTFPPKEFIRMEYTKTTELPYGKYLVVVGQKIIPLIYNNTGWSNYNDSVTHVYIPAFN